MPANKFLLPDKTRLLKIKLDQLTANLQASVGATGLKTKEAIIFESIKALNAFYKDLNEPQTEVPNIHSDSLPDVVTYNNLWQQLLGDLITIFSELENIESLTVANFNYITTEANRLTARLKAVSSKLGDYILYSLNPTRDALFFKDSFNDLSKIDFNTVLLNKDQAEISQIEGIVTLPVDRAKKSTLVIREAPIINPNSNGVVGNNQELGVAYHGDLGDLLDNNPDSWFEYERVVTRLSDDKEPLVLDLTINLGEPKVINHIRINPNNFGTKTVIHIDSIDTSLNGDVYTSIKDDIPIAGFTTEDEENIFSLAPSTSKYAGQGFYTFTPRKAKYIHLVLRQTEPYIINTSTGEKLRYAIGLRDIDIRAFVYKPEGEVVSIAFSTEDEIRKVLLQTNQNPTELSELAAIDYFVSSDNGATWHAIQPKQLSGISGTVSTQEVVEFNGSSSNTVKTAVPAKSLRLKAVLSRNDEGFEEGSSSFYKRRLTKSELHSVPTESPFSMDLEEPPIDGTVVVVDPLFGSRGLPRSPYILGHVTDRLDLRKYRLPFTNYPRPVKKVLSGGKYHVELLPASEWQNLEVGGTSWAQATAALSTYDSSDKVYTFDTNTGIIEFGDGTHGQAPAENEPIVIWFKPERIYPSEISDDHIAKLEFTTSANKEDMVIKRYDKIESATMIVPKKATVIRLGHKNIVDLGNITSVFTGTQRDFLNGKDELLGTGEWSIDITEGIIYLYDPTSDATQYSISYQYQPVYILDKEDWDWANTNLLRDSVTLKETAWKTISIAEEEVLMEDDVTVLDIAHLSAVRGTFKFNLTDSGGDPVASDETPFQKEVTFQDGLTELGSPVVKAKEQVPALAIGLNTVAFGEKIVTDTEFAVLFSDSTVFTTDVSPAVPDADGEYSIDRSSGDTGVYKVYTDSVIASPGTVTYFYTNQNFSVNGLYSIDYRYGRIYTQVPMDATWTCKISYDYVDFRAEYRIARMLDPTSYKVDITNRKVVVNDTEILDHLMIPHGRMDSRMPYYLVNYDYVSQTREDIASLKDYFSPVIKDYALKVLLKGRIY